MTRQKAVIVKSAAGDEIEMPGWFLIDRHELTAGGIRESATGLYLAADGLPQAMIARAQALAAAGKHADPLAIVPDAMLRQQHEDLAADAAAKKETLDLAPDLASADVVKSGTDGSVA
jgi:hypothetical protein